MLNLAQSQFGVQVHLWNISGKICMSRSQEQKSFCASDSNCWCGWQACWVIQCFSELQYKDAANEHHVIESMRNMVHSDNDLPVRLEAAIALQMLLKHQDSGINHTSLVIGGHFYPVALFILIWCDQWVHRVLCNFFRVIKFKFVAHCILNSC